LVRRTGKAKIAKLEILEAVFRLGQLAFEHANFLVDEAARLFGVTAFFTHTGIDKQLHQALHEALGALRIGIAVGDCIEVLAHGLNANRGHELVDGRIELARRRLFKPDDRLGKEVLDVGPRDQRLGQHGHLLVDIGLKSDVLHQWLEHGLRVDVDLRGRLEPLRHDRHHHASDNRQRPRHGQMPKAIWKIFSITSSMLIWCKSRPIK